MIGLLCRTPQKESRHELLRRVAAGGGAFKGENGTKVHIPGANLNDIANQADDLLEVISRRRKNLFYFFNFGCFRYLPSSDVLIHLLLLVLFCKVVCCVSSVAIVSNVSLSLSLIRYPLYDALHCFIW